MLHAKQCFFVLFAIFLAISCNTTAPPENLTIYYGSDSIIATITDSTITALLPFNVRRDSLRVNFDGYDTTINATETLRLDGRTIRIQSYTAIPIVYLTTPGPIVSKDTYIPGTITIDGNTLYAGITATMQIKGRGNSTWSLPKKPYKIKLDSKAAVLGMPADKEWALLANYYDKSLARNDVAFELSERLEMPWTPRRRFVEVFLNGHYDGQYLLCETVKAGTSRANVGQLMEADYRMDGDQWFGTPQGVKFVLKDPEKVTAGRFDTIKQTMIDMESRIANYKDIRGSADLDNWIRWMLVNEVMRNADAPLVSSCFFSLTGNVVSMGPVWDFDQSSGSYPGNVAEGWYVNQGFWFGGLFLYHPYYKQRVKEIWNQYRPRLSTLAYYADSSARSRMLSNAENYRRWDNLSGTTYEAEVNTLYRFLSDRFAWMDAQINSF